MTCNTQSGNGDRYKWTGREADSETGLQYNRARLYASQVGRWTSQDPLGFAADDVNLYRCVHNNPVAYLDPLGLWTIYRNKDKESIPALSERNDTVKQLATTLGLKEDEFHQWLQPFGPDDTKVWIIRNGLGEQKPWDELRSDDRLAARQTFLIPNVIYCIWVGPFNWISPLGIRKVEKAFVRWEQNLQYLRALGFHVQEYDREGDVKRYPPKYVLDIIKTFTKTHKLHGFYFWGHGSVGGFGTQDGKTWTVTYNQLSDALQYRLAFVLINACESYEGAKLLSHKGGIWWGSKETLNPFIPREWMNTWDKIKSGDQATLTGISP